MPPLQCEFLNMCTFSYGHLFLVAIFYQLTSEKNQVHAGYLTHCRQTLRLIKFYLVKNVKGNRRNWLAQFKFPILKYSVIIFSYHIVKFTVSLSLLFICLFAFLTILTILYFCQKMQGAYEMCTVTGGIM